MKYIQKYDSPLGEILLACDELGLSGLWFSHAKYFSRGLFFSAKEKDMPVFCDAKRWLDIYFTGKQPDFVPNLHLIGSSFQLSVWELLKKIPYGTTTTYKDLSLYIAKAKGCRQMSAQAIGGAVSKNPVSIIVPCHRVVSVQGKLTGYAGGLDKKEYLLNLEKN